MAVIMIGSFCLNSDRRITVAPPSKSRSPSTTAVCRHRSDCRLTMESCCDNGVSGRWCPRGADRGPARIPRTRPPRVAWPAAVKGGGGRTADLVPALVTTNSRIRSASRPEDSRMPCAESCLPYRKPRKRGE